MHGTALAMKCVFLWLSDVSGCLIVLVLQVEEEKEDKPKTKKVDKTTWDWVIVNDNKPLWTRK